MNHKTKKIFNPLNCTRREFGFEICKRAGFSEENATKLTDFAELLFQIEDDHVSEGKPPYWVHKASFYKIKNGVLSEGTLEELTGYPELKLPLMAKIGYFQDEATTPPYHFGYCIDPNGVGSGSTKEEMLLNLDINIRQSYRYQHSSELGEYILGLTKGDTWFYERMEKHQKKFWPLHEAFERMRHEDEEFQRLIALSERKTPESEWEQLAE